MNQPRISAIVCQDCVGGIGLSSSLDLPWGKHKEDMAFFKQTTKNSVCIMGKNTYLSIAKHVKTGDQLLKDRICIVLMSDPHIYITDDGCFNTPYKDMYAINGIETALSWARYAISYHNDAAPYATPLNDNIFCIGGRSIYEQAVPYVDTLYLNIIKGDYQADIKFPHDAYKSFRIETVNRLADDLVSLTLQKG